jgi:hypothetical protein
MDDMKQRLARLEAREGKKRRLALEVMSEVGLTKLAEPDFTASLRKGCPVLMVVAEQEIPNEYWIPQPAKLDRQTVLSKLKAGIQVPGAELSNIEPVLSVRTK